MQVSRSILSSLVAAVLAVSLASACSDSSDGGGNVGANCAGFASDVCNKLNSCFPFLIEISYGDVAKCVERNEMGCNEQIDAPGANTDGPKLAACGNALEGVTCEALTTDTPEACDIPGSLADGQPCQFNSQCTSEHCRVANNATCGTCAARSAAGGSCDVGDDCEDNLVCSNSVCATPVAAGGACTTGSQCGPTLVCKAGTCALPDGAGAACTEGSCDILHGFFCIQGTCKAVQAVAAGETCGFIDGSLVICAAQGTCTGLSVTNPTGTCSPAAADGATCSTDDSGPKCIEPARCINGSCQLPNPGSCT
jgi:hypothetical protein